MTRSAREELIADDWGVAPTRSRPCATLVGPIGGVASEPRLQVGVDLSEVAFLGLGDETAHEDPAERGDHREDPERFALADDDGDGQEDQADDEVGEPVHRGGGAGPGGAGAGWKDLAD